MSECGSPTYIDYQLVLDDDGVETLVPCGIVDLHAEIQTHAASLDVNYLVQKYMSGDDSALERANAFYGDVSELPVRLQDVLNLNKQGKTIFDKLPAEVRNLYNNSYMEFVQHPEIFDDYLYNLGNPESVETAVDKPVESEVTNGESE